ncbi:MAG TPA: arginine deiminase [Petrotogaceae bacterium]|jgi:arginine deiminase|nr:arginine deiminase [Petrotogaceae bacterium]HNY36912.1 arginine deiminase [Petrotogaceae bacterium]HOG35265.1 arginine deiminase [Petrotogaceae bacterium]HPX15895.1 arginine deiminase [Petrotogaceae bacterium]HQC41103.1 arginine deiminase [Petrotogaceae bacterium]
MNLNVYSEIGNLKKVMLHRPSKELENLAPEYLQELLFDDIPYLEKAQQEHDEFASILRNEGVEVVYLLDLLQQTLSSWELKSEFLREFIDMSEITNPYISQALYDFLVSMDTRAMIEKLVCGLRTEELGLKKDIFSVQVRKSKLNHPFFLDPLVNLYFQRDPVAVVGRGATINRMNTPARRRESMFMEYVLKYHPDFSRSPFYYSKDMPYSIEGGDILILNRNTLAIGISQRTEPEALEIIAKKVFYEYGDEFDTIIGVLIPSLRAFMHLDTVFTMVDYDKFVVHSKLEKNMKFFTIRKKEKDEFEIAEETAPLNVVLEKYLKIKKVTLIKCGGSDDIAASREQWNDGSNSLAIRPGVVVVYDRNRITNAELKKYGITTLEMPSSELSCGRGGPRCMSMPLFRQD